MIRCILKRNFCTKHAFTLGPRNTKANLIDLAICLSAEKDSSLQSLQGFSLLIKRYSVLMFCKENHMCNFDWGKIVRPDRRVAV